MPIGPLRSPSRTATLRIVTGLRGSGMPPDVLSLFAAQEVVLGRLLGRPLEGRLAPGRRTIALWQSRATELTS